VKAGVDGEVGLAVPVLPGVDVFVPVGVARDFPVIGVTEGLVWEEVGAVQEASSNTQKRRATEKRLLRFIAKRVSLRQCQITIVYTFSTPLSPERQVCPDYSPVGSSSR